MPEPITIIAVVGLSLTAGFNLIDMCIKHIKIDDSTFYDVIYIDIDNSHKLCYAIEKELELNNHLPTIYSDLEKKYKNGKKWKIIYNYDFRNFFPQLNNFIVDFKNKIKNEIAKIKFDNNKYFEIFNNIIKNVLSFSLISVPKYYFASIFTPLKI